jgi:hypothetical protein
LSAGETRPVLGAEEPDGEKELRMRSTKLASLSVMAAVAMTGAVACDIDQTREGKMPDVDVQADAGRLPEYEVRKTREGRMPEVDVDVEEKTFEVPYPDVDVDVDMPDEEDDIE